MRVAQRAAGTHSVTITICIGPPPSPKSYLSIPAVIAACEITGAEAIFRIQCFEDESLSIRTRPWEEGIDLAAVKPDGKTAMILRLTCTGAL